MNLKDFLSRWGERDRRIPPGHLEVAPGLGGPLAIAQRSLPGFRQTRGPAIVPLMSETWTIARVLGWTTSYFADKGLDSPRLDAELLIADALKLTRLQVYTRHDQPLHPDELTAVRARVQRRGRREPVAYITGTRGFWSLELAVDARVLVPRPETELLVELALARLKGLEAPRVVDVGTGSGCIALSLARERPDAVITAVDASQGALAVAQKNAQTLDLKVEFRQSNLLSAVPGPLEMVVSNPPYIASAEVDQLMPDVARYEPRLALDGGPDGLALIRPLIDQAATRLVPEGWLAFEFGHDQGPAVRDLLLADGRFGDVIIHRDLAGKDRVATARRLP